MKKCLFSTYIKTDDMDIIKEEIELFNAMKRIAFSNVRILGGDKTVKEKEPFYPHVFKEPVPCVRLFHQ